MTSTSSKNPFGDFMEARPFEELPMANEPDIIESLNATLSTGMQDEETHKARLRVQEQNELTRLKTIVERWETELQHVFNLYQDSIFRNLLGSTKERIRILEELELTGADLSLLQELRSRVAELNEKGDRAKRLMRQNFLDVDKSINYPSISRVNLRGMSTVQDFIYRPMDTVSHARQRAMEIGDRWRTRLVSYLDHFGNLLGFFMIFFFGNLTWRERGLHLVHGLQNFSLYMIDQWRDQLQELDREQALEARRQQFERDRMGIFGLFFAYFYSMFMFPLRAISFFWLFGWASWGMYLSKRFVVQSYDYFAPIYSSTHSFNDKVFHVINDAKTNLEDKSAQFSQNVKTSIAKGTHIAMAPLETATEKYVHNHAVKDSLQKAFGAVDSLLAQTSEQRGVQRSGSEQEVPLITRKKKKRGTGISPSGITGTANPVIGKR